MSRQYDDLKALATGVVLPTDEVELCRVALETIASRGVPSYLTPYGSVRSVAAFATGKKDDPFYHDGELLLKAALAADQFEDAFEHSERKRSA